MHAFAAECGLVPGESKPPSKAFATSQTLYPDPTPQNPESMIFAEVQRGPQCLRRGRSLGGSKGGRPFTLIPVLLPKQMGVSENRGP